jgi:hypothetical protein
MDLRRRTPLTLAGICGRKPGARLHGHDDAYLLAPGLPERSLIYLRTRMEGPGAMPPARHSVDAEGTKLVAAWIRSLEECP